MTTLAVKDNLELGILTQVRDWLRELSPEAQKQLKQRFEDLTAAPCPDAEEQALAEEMTGISYPDSVKELELSNLVNSFVLRNELLKDSISGAEVDRILGCKSRQTRIDRVKNNTLLAVKDNGVWKFPFWQFDVDGADRVIEGLPQVLACLKVSNLAKVSWLTRPHAIFAAKTPLEVLKQGKLELVLNEARGVGIAQ
ncbi:MAG: hypothetical protein AAFV28_02495 [Cyanobacteria bacterium J06635_13]